MNFERHPEFEPQPSALERVIFYLEDRYHNADAMQRSTSARIQERPDDYQPARGTFVDYDYHDSLQGLFSERIILGPPDDVSNESAAVARLEAILHSDNSSDTPEHDVVDNRGQEVITRLFARRMHVYRPVDMETLVPLSEMGQPPAYCVRFESDDGDRSKDIYFTVDRENGIQQFDVEASEVPAHFQAMRHLLRSLESTPHDRHLHSHNHTEDWEDDTFELFLDLAASFDIDKQEMAQIWESMLSERNLIAFRGKHHYGPLN